MREETAETPPAIKMKACTVMGKGGEASYVTPDLIYDRGGAGEVRQT